MLKTKIYTDWNGQTLEILIGFCPILNFQGCKATELYQILDLLDNNNDQNEYYLSDVLNILANCGKSVEIYCVSKFESHCINTIE